MTQIVNDQMIDELRASFFHKRRELWCLANNDVRPNDDRRGLAARFVNPTGLTTWTSHFRTGDVAGAGELAAYSWINDGTFTAAPALIDYSYVGEFLIVTGAGRQFLARAITNNVANWRDMDMYGRFTTGAATEIGLRFDSGADGTANEFYCEIVLIPTAAAFDVAFRSRIHGAGAVTVLAGAAIPCGTSVTIRLRSNWDGANLTGAGYLVNEAGLSASVGSSAALTAYYPQAGRAGIYQATSGNYAMCDWFNNQFT